MDGVTPFIWWGPIAGGLLLGLLGRAWSGRPWWLIALLVPLAVAAGFVAWLVTDDAPMGEPAPWVLIGWLALLSLPPAAAGAGIVAIAARLRG